MFKIFRKTYTFEFAGIPFRVNGSAFVSFALITALVGIGNHYLIEYRFEALGFTWPLGIRVALTAGTVLILYVSLLIHEFAHIFSAVGCGYKISSITISAFGITSDMDRETTNAKDEFRIATAGLKANFFVFVLALIGLAYAGANQTLEVFWLYVCYINAVILILNLIPVIPFDGGRMLKSHLWRRSRNRYKASKIPANLGQILGMVLYLAVIVSFVLWGVSHIYDSWIPEAINPLPAYTELGVVIFASITSGLISLIGIYVFYKATVYKLKIRQPQN